MHPYFSYPSLILYFVLALVGMSCASHTRKSMAYNQSKTLSINSYAIAWLIIWSVIAIFRLVRDGIGGSDAIGYIEYFVKCKEVSGVHTDADPMFKWINWILRSISSDYHILFTFIYPFFILSFISFVQRFSCKEFPAVSFLLIFFLFLRGFSSIRSNLAISFLLFALVFLAKEKKLWSLIFGCCACLTHKIAIVYFMVVPFCMIFKTNKIKMTYALAMVAICYVGAMFLRPYFVTFSQIVDLGGAYGSYAEALMNDSVFSWVNDFGQMALGVVMCLFSKRLRNEIDVIDKDRGNKVMSLLWTICIFDFLMVPVNQLLGIYRGYEFLYLARLCMWGVILFVYTKRMSSSARKFVCTCAFMVFATWFVFRISRTYEDTCLMPYFFAPFSELI